MESSLRKKNKAAFRTHKSQTAHSSAGWVGFGFPGLCHYLKTMELQSVFGTWVWLTPVFLLLLTE